MEGKIYSPVGKFAEQAKKMILLSITLTYMRRDGGLYPLLRFLQFLMRDTVDKLLFLSFIFNKALTGLTS